MFVQSLTGVQEKDEKKKSSSGSRQESCELVVSMCIYKDGEHTQRESCVSTPSEKYI